MKKNTYFRESLACYLFCAVFLIGFFGVMFITAELSGNSLSSFIPELSRDMFIKWEDIKAIFDFKE
ncbi:hypothetical protein FHE72_04985 [Rossellomorea vietnamensis]|jgi:hypothetical protein|uniref:Uncharacterized protein n=1 Tax=Rossellomorea vietnamensis TaxID=218284 RepID=A0A6I6UET2_9BACI|nr:hypothetical protein [Rossellomorea vietnamensis]QHE60468.1 hypothetical protein FHE72_04985 [Rossellomorea vietnamensis]